MNTKRIEVGQLVTGLYPKGGNRNILRRFKGETIAKGEAGNGPYITVQESCGKIRSFLDTKIVGIVQEVA